MRTPNCKCIICEKPLYRRPGELASVRHVACMKHRAEAQVLSGITEAQLKGLSLGREKGKNHLAGIPKSEESKRRRSIAMKRWCAEHPRETIERCAVNRGENHYRWRGGANRLNTSIRTLTENRKWMDGVKAKDGTCSKCGSEECLESHHVIPLADLIERHSIKTRDQARDCAALWDLDNGMALCQSCHYAEHGRTHAD